MYEMDEKCRKCKNNGTAICNRCDAFYDEFEYKTDESGKVIKKWKKYWIAAAQAPSASS